MKHFSIYVLLSILTALPLFSQHLTLRLLSAPEAVLINGSATVYLEYFLTNNSADTLTLEKLELTTPGTAAAILSLDRNQLRAHLHRLESTAKVDATVMPPGTSNVLYLEPETGRQNRFDVLLGYSLHHKNKKESHTFRGNFTLEKKTPLVLGAPLREGTWVAVYDPAWERGHRRVLYKGDSVRYLPGRYAIDFIRVDDQGRYARNNEDAISNWHGYGADVLAVSDGTVLSVRTNFPESATLSAHHQPGTEDATGNYIALQIGGGRVVFYEHLKPGSIKVQPGQQVKKGDVIASLGFTGQSTGPHLHFHVADRNSPLRAEGVPFVFDRFTFLGAYTNLENFGSKMWSPGKNKVVQQERPGPNVVITFGSPAFPSAAKINLADSLRYVDNMPYICHDMESESGCGTAVFWRVVQQKQAVIPDLISMLTDTTQTAATVPNFGGQFAVSDVAYAALHEIIHDIPTFQLLGVKFDNKGCGYCAYWNHVRKDIRNRKKFQAKVRDWYDKNKTNLTWVTSNDFSTCDCAGPHPNGGHFEVKK